MSTAIISARGSSAHCSKITKSVRPLFGVRRTINQPPRHPSMPATTVISAPFRCVMEQFKPH
jgi:hypothetical protein